MTAAVLGILSGLVALLPVLLNMREARKVKADALRTRSLNELHAATDGRLLDDTPVSPQ